MFVGWNFNFKELKWGAFQYAKYKVRLHANKIMTFVTFSLSASYGAEHKAGRLRAILQPKENEIMTMLEEDIGVWACYRTQEIVQSLWKELPHRTKDYIANPKRNGYRSLHMAVDVSDDVRTTPIPTFHVGQGPCLTWKS